MDKGFEFQDQQMNFRHRLNIPSLGMLSSPNENAPPGEPLVNSIIPKGQVPEPGRNKFLVFDQSNDRTTFIYYTSSIPIPYHLPEPHFTFNLKKDDSLVEKHTTHSSNSFHEDTEDLKALLYSDDSQDEEEQSTGHSPVMGFNSHQQVATSVKRRKLDSGGYDVVLLEDTATSAVNCSAEVELLSSCGGHGNRVPEETFLPAGKRSTKQKVREIISVLQNLIPGGNNGKDAMLILDEAINYLRILKVKAKALGLQSL